MDHWKLDFLQHFRNAVGSVEDKRNTIMEWIRSAESEKELLLGDYEKEALLVSSSLRPAFGGNSKKSHILLNNESSDSSDSTQVED